ncbi:hypothetical protein A2526_01115 [candidate division WOR-1 bacterium RIFOXYD2_FULL_36_8]|uniref:Histidine kinase N-terminal 7TM region domain-containing protein n=1 Tax=candidate division WOR-1 bacterium RIFOXYB2_FULL_36_35 TaxID=1802578 RepID=A0A1F4RXY4_UNCSA|nr:MAG: hypothetical protein A2230_08635 [candidate division WOR-1 bacterium RIFOXYA2_FULL_36_21]OGC13032.1 MAG: hypothetical protein A2290_00460 [candidate division WOR-1 bacterium RIFOXYB2_FULL_36_35]OGC20996.1 MAG: hypothetical protein A2282_05770 [candidate division WOR-1 bacterium RIFOXYA12_FULL_36_13]OGC38970.1 MAG: hypothetical protein A2526_01115 [candidate division WOR-1 bacterium RIFOXYD2_FULL_36_8]
MQTFLINWECMLLTTAFVVTLGLGLFAYLKGSNDEVNISFSFMLFGLTFWAGSLLAFLLVRDFNWALIIRKLTPIGSSILMGYFLYFSILFPKKHDPLPLAERYLILAPGFIFAMISVFTPLMIKNIQFINGEYPFLGRPVFGELYLVYSVYLITYFASAVTILIYKYLFSEGREKLQIFYVAFGALLAGVGGIFVSLFFPLVNVVNLFTIGPVFILVASFFITYAIIKYRLLGIEDFLTRGLALFFILFAFVGTIMIFIYNKASFLPAFYLMLIQGALGLLIYFKDRRNEVNFSFTYFNLSFALWVYFMYMIALRPVLFLSFYHKYVFVVSALMFSFLLYFTSVFPKPKKDFMAVFSRTLIFIFPAIIFLLTLYDFMLKNIDIKAGIPVPAWGSGYPVFVFLSFAYIFFSLFNLLKSYLFLQGKEKAQALCLFLGLALSLFFLGSTTWLVPWFRGVRIIMFAPFSVLFFVFFTSYAILKYHFMDIEIVFRRGFVYGTIRAFVMILYALVLLVTERILWMFIGGNSIVVTSLSIVVFAAFFQPFVNFLQNLADRFFFHEYYDYQISLLHVSRLIADYRAYNELVNFVIKTFSKTMQAVYVSFLIPREAEYLSLSLNMEDKEIIYKKMRFDKRLPVIRLIEESLDVVSLDYLEEQIFAKRAFGKSFGKSRDFFIDVKDAMEKESVSVIVPVVLRGRIIGIVALGYKVSKDIYTQQDLMFLMTIANQSAVVFDNINLLQD